MSCLGLESRAGERDLDLVIVATPDHWPTARRSRESEVRRDRVYCARAILDILEEPARLEP